MLLKLLLLGGCALVVWFLARAGGRRRLSAGKKSGDKFRDKSRRESQMVCCPHCGVYHDGDVTCECRR